jgi:bile acid-coenzyme A ligase
MEGFLDKSGEPAPGAPLGILLTSQAARRPDGPALTTEHATATFGELEAGANRRARWFSELGVGRDDVVVIALPNGREFYETTIACWKLGALAAPVSHLLTEIEFAAIVGLCRPRLVVGRPAPSVADCPHVGQGGVPDPATPAEPPLPVVARSWKITATGGSTGLPKLVVDTAPSTWGPQNIALGRATGTTVLNAAPLYHAAPFGLVIPAVLQGCHVVEMGRFDAERWLALVDHHKVEWVYMVPTMMARIARLPAAAISRYDLSSLSTLLHLAAPCPDWLKRFWIDLIGPDTVWEIYGGAERFGATLIGGREWLAHPGSVGRPQPGTEVRICDEAGAVLPTGEVGEIQFRRAQPTSLLRTKDGEAPQGGDWSSFGDVGRLDAEGYLYVVDRHSDLILCGGANLYPSEIEAALSSCPGVLGVVVVGLPDADLGEAAHAIVQCSSDVAAMPTVAELKAHLDGRLARNKHPRSFEFTTRSIRDDAGKVRRSAWRQEALARLLPAGSREGPGA